MQQLQTVAQHQACELLAFWALLFLLEEFIKKWFHLLPTRSSNIGQWKLWNGSRKFKRPQIIFKSCKLLQTDYSAGRGWPNAEIEKTWFLKWTSNTPEGPVQAVNWAFGISEVPVFIYFFLHRFSFLVIFILFLFILHLLHNRTEEMPISCTRFAIVS